MPNRYERLPNPANDPHNDELEAAFDDSGDESDEREEEEFHHNQRVEEQRPLVSRDSSRSTGAATTTTTTTGGHYDFERVDYDYPPPGSPPAPSSTALPANAAYGNTNGLVPTSPIERPAPPPSAATRPFLTRFIPFYDRVFPNSAGARERRVGGGSENDGVFANLMSKPTRARRIEDEEGVHFVPEETQTEAPPSYSAAQADAVPSYWETTIHAPSGGDVEGELVVDSLPTGSLFSFLWSMLVSVAFNFLGFVLTYLLHTTHAAKFGSRAGLGITLIQYGWALRNRPENPGSGDDALDALMGSGGNDGFPAGVSVGEDGRIDLSGVNWGNETMAAAAAANAGEGPGPYFGESAAAWLSFSLMTIGWFLFLSSFLGFWRVKRWERGILRAAPSASDTLPSAGVPADQPFSLGFSFPGSFLREGLGLSAIRRGDEEEGLGGVGIHHGHEHDVDLSPTSRGPGAGVGGGGGGEGGERFVVQEIDRQRQIAEVRINDAQLHRNLRAAGLI